jgi:hypothetical protein
MLPTLTAANYLPLTLITAVFAYAFLGSFFLSGGEARIRSRDDRKG